MKNSAIRLLLVFICLQCSLATTAFAQTAHQHKKGKLSASRQLMVVLTDGWDTLRGKLYGFQRRDNKWVLQFANPVVIGAKGLATGDGQYPLVIKNAPVKHEGDKRSPAGIFSIGTAFGYAEKKDAAWIKNPYIRAFDTLICVDDMHSPNYNKLVDKDTAKKDYNSFEYMHLTKDYYKWGLFINHNSPGTVRGDGSCIFLHIWENDHIGTDGCTAMAETNVLRILHWINGKDNPLLVQVPVNEYVKLRREYGLPEIQFE
jgi:D-alanyl-D-alanine dipeptidase